MQAQERFPTDGESREGKSVSGDEPLIWCESKTDSIVWMREDTLRCICQIFLPPDICSGGFIVRETNDAMRCAHPNKKRKGVCSI